MSVLGQKQTYALNRFEQGCGSAEAIMRFWKHIIGTAIFSYSKLRAAAEDK
jgi:hypothetical protein